MLWFKRIIYRLFFTECCYESGENQNNYDNSKGKRESNPQWGKNPNPWPRNNTCQFENNERDCKQSSESNSATTCLCCHIFLLCHFYYLSKIVLKSLWFFLTFLIIYYEYQYVNIFWKVLFSKDFKKFSENTGMSLTIFFQIHNVVDISKKDA